MQAMTEHTKVTLHVLQVMVILGPVQLEGGDVQGANTMLGSSLTLSKHLRDLPTQVMLSTSPGAGSGAVCG